MLRVWNAWGILQTRKKGMIILSGIDLYSSKEKQFCKHVIEIPTYFFAAGFNILSFKRKEKGLGIFFILSLNELVRS